jgi:hypothetical protein
MVSEIIALTKFVAEYNFMSLQKINKKVTTFEARRIK